MNQICLVGRLSQEPKLFGNDDNKVCLLTIAVKRAFPNQSGEFEADFIQVKTFKKTAENCSKFLQKGSMVSIVGHIVTGSYTKDGKKVYTSENIADSVRFLAGIKGSNDENNSNNARSNQNRNNQSVQQMDEDPFAGSEQYDSNGDNDWPFS